MAGSVLFPAWYGSQVRRASHLESGEVAMAKKSRGKPALKPRERWAVRAARVRGFMLLVEPNKWTLFSKENGRQLIIYLPDQRLWVCGRQRGGADFPEVLRMARDIEKKMLAKPEGY